MLGCPVVNAKKDILAHAYERVKSNQVANYADDFVMLSRGHAAEALSWTRQVMPRIGLTLNETKSSIRQARTERFDFLRYTFGPHHLRKMVVESRCGAVA